MDEIFFEIQSMSYELMRKYGIKPQKKLGQHFLLNDKILSDISDCAELSPNDHVVEVGPGFGMLTRHLLDRAGFVVAVEYDGSMIPILSDIFKENDRLIIVEENILDLSNRQLCEFFDMPGLSSYKVVANIPYNITALLMRKFTEQSPIPSLCVFLVQKEVAKRICAPSGELSVLGVAVQFYMEVEYFFEVPAKEFEPAPAVDSAVIRLRPHSRYSELLTSSGVDISTFFRVVRMGFSAKRKQLHNNLSAGLRCSSDDIKMILSATGLSATVRAQELSIDDWIALTKSLHGSSYMI